MNVVTKLIIAQMAMDRLSAATIDFFIHAYPLLSREGGAICMDLSRSAYMTTQAAAKHLKTLNNKGYIEKGVERNTWRSKPASKLIKDPDFQKFSSFMGSPLN